MTFEFLHETEVYILVSFVPNVTGLTQSHTKTRVHLRSPPPFPGSRHDMRVDGGITLPHHNMGMLSEYVYRYVGID